MLEGEMPFELEGEPPRVIRAREAFWEPGGDVIVVARPNRSLKLGVIRRPSTPGAVLRIRPTSRPIMPPLPFSPTTSVRTL